MGQTSSALRSSTSQNLAAVSSSHSLAETVLHLAMTLLGLVSTEHDVAPPFNHSKWCCKCAQKHTYSLTMWYYTLTCPQKSSKNSHRMRIFQGFFRALWLSFPQNTRYCGIWAFAYGKIATDFAVGKRPPYEFYWRWRKDCRGELRSPAGGHRPPLRILSTLMRDRRGDS